MRQISGLLRSVVTLATVFSFASSGLAQQLCPLGQYASNPNSWIVASPDNACYGNEITYARLIDTLEEYGREQCGAQGKVAYGDYGRILQPLDSPTRPTSCGPASLYRLNTNWCFTCVSAPLATVSVDVKNLLDATIPGSESPSLWITWNGKNGEPPSVIPVVSGTGSFSVPAGASGTFRVVAKHYANQQEYQFNGVSNQQFSVVLQPWMQVSECSTRAFNASALDNGHALGPSYQLGRDALLGSSGRFSKSEGAMVSAGTLRQWPGAANDPNVAGYRLHRIFSRLIGRVPSPAEYSRDISLIMQWRYDWARYAQSFLAPAQEAAQLRINWIAVNALNRTLAGDELRYWSEQLGWGDREESQRRFSDIYFEFLACSESLALTGGRLDGWAARLLSNVKGKPGSLDEVRGLTSWMTSNFGGTTLLERRDSVGLQARKQVVQALFSGSDPGWAATFAQHFMAYDSPQPTDPAQCIVRFF